MGNFRCKCGNPYRFQEERDAGICAACVGDPDEGFVEMATCWRALNPALRHQVLFRMIEGAGNAPHGPGERHDLNVFLEKMQEAMK